ncbi:MAG TPA: hypothetical protein DDW52_27320 [Planctomycetaceae bacterium]|nr:hypothetical protein [Planctomycetaceae bacterium]
MAVSVFGTLACLWPSLQSANKTRKSKQSKSDDSSPGLEPSKGANRTRFRVWIDTVAPDRSEQARRAIAVSDSTYFVAGYCNTLESLLQAVHRGQFVESSAISINEVTRPSRLGLAVATVGWISILRFLWLFLIGQGDGYMQSLVLTINCRADVRLWSYGGWCGSESQVSRNCIGVRLPVGRPRQKTRLQEQASLHAN